VPYEEVQQTITACKSWERCATTVIVLLLHEEGKGDDVCAPAREMCANLPHIRGLAPTSRGYRYLYRTYSQTLPSACNL